MGDMPERIRVKAYLAGTDMERLSVGDVQCYDTPAHNGFSCSAPYHREDTCTANRARLREKIEAARVAWGDARGAYGSGYEDALDYILALLDSNATEKEGEQK